MIDPNLRARADGAGLVFEFNGDVSGYFGPQSTVDDPVIWRGYDGCWYTEVGGQNVKHASEAVALRSYLGMDS